MMPQFDVSTFPSQIFWLMVCFAILCFVMVHFLVPRMGTAISNRQQTLRHYQESADKMTREADLLSEQNHRSFESARFDVNQKVHQSLTDLNQERDTHLAEYEKTVQQKLQRMNETLSEQKAEILKDTEQLISHLAREALTRIMGQTMDEALIKQSILAIKTQR